MTDLDLNASVAMSRRDALERCRRDVEELTGTAPNVEGKP